MSDEFCDREMVAKPTRILELRLIGERKDQIDSLFFHLKVCTVIETVTIQKWYF
jgi:hypothetical protein